MTTAFLPGSFDPIHLGHLDVIVAAASLFDVVVVAAMHNPGKPAGRFPIDERVGLIRASVAGVPNVRVEACTGLVVDAAAASGADLIVKGLRTAGDFEVELQMALTNESVTGIRTVFLPTAAAHSFLSSRFIREIAHYGGDVAHLVPPPVADRFAAEGGQTPSPRSTR